MVQIVDSIRTLTTWMILNFLRRQHGVMAVSINQTRELNSVSGLDGWMFVQGNIIMSSTSREWSDFGRALVAERMEQDVFRA